MQTSLKRVSLGEKWNSTLMSFNEKKNAPKNKVFYKKKITNMVENILTLTFFENFVTF